MSDSFVRVAPDSTGQKIQTFENTVGGNVVEAQAVVLVNSSGVPYAPISSIPAYQTTRVDPGGDDSTGQIDNVAKPFATFAAAMTALEAHYGETVAAGDVSVSSTTVTSASGIFKSYLVGNILIKIAGAGAGGSEYLGHITSVTDSHTATLQTPVSTPVTNADVKVQGQTTVVTVLVAGNYAATPVTTTIKTLQIIGRSVFGDLVGNITRNSNFDPGSDYTFVNCFAGDITNNASGTIGIILVNSGTGNISGAADAIAGEGWSSTGNITSGNGSQALNISGISSIFGTVNNSGGPIKVTDCSGYYDDDAFSIDNGSGNVTALGCYLQNIVSAGTLTLIDSRVQGTNSASSTVYADASLAKATTSAPGLLPPLSGNATDVFKGNGTFGAGAGGGDFSSNTSTSVDSEIVLFSGTAGKTGKRATGSGIPKITSGVLGTSNVTDDAQIKSADFPSSSVDSEIALFSGTGGKAVKRATGSGIPKITSGVLGTSNVTDDAQTKATVVPNTAPSSGQVLVGNAGGTAYAPQTVSGSGATATMSSAGVLTLSAIPNATLSNSAITIAGSSTSLGGSITLDTIDNGVSSVGFIKRTGANTRSIIADPLPVANGGTGGTTNNGGWSIVQLTADATTTSLTAVDVAGASGPTLVTPTLANSTLYEFEANLYVVNAADTTGMKFGARTITGTGAAATVLVTGLTTNAAAASSGVTGVGNNLATTAFDVVSAQVGYIKIWGFYLSGSTGTPVIAATFAKVTSNTATVKSGSILRWRIMGQ